ncbi:hypothetical protein CERZMDRAFT_118292 [Cercospora zeae-maydis SCOH1-5]|uniref:F-box domain-containing protein n=1 Tax=Cercospora zeae-maydis SCOH1-5 TaxID=717836 RepID=A0A6A6F9I0_9PEZI|nr:hypothetical protein CERZMDRAFT_118292 [Cercospora zeae-maydis SCOH1-5]
MEPFTKNETFPLLTFPAEVVENVAKFCDEDSLGALRLTSRRAESETYREWHLRRRIIEFSSNHDKPAVYATILKNHPQAGSRVTRLILSLPGGHRARGPWCRASLISNLTRIVKHLPNLREVEISDWTIKHYLPHLAELAPIFKNCRLQRLFIARCIFSALDLRALLGTPLVAPEVTQVEDCDIMGAIVSEVPPQAAVPRVRTEHAFCAGVQQVWSTDVLHAVFPAYDEFHGLKYEISTFTGKRVFVVGGLAPMDERNVQRILEVTIVKSE